MSLTCELSGRGRAVKAGRVETGQTILAREAERMMKRQEVIVEPMALSPNIGVYFFEGSVGPAAVAMLPEVSLQFGGIQAIWNVAEINQRTGARWIEPSGLAQDLDATIVVQSEFAASLLENANHLLLTSRSQAIFKPIKASLNSLHS